MQQEDPKSITVRFNEAINRRDLEALVALMSDDHLFVDSANNQMHGRTKLRAVWSQFFAAFPDYQNVFTSVFQRDDRVYVLGYSTCAEPALSGPAIWTALVRDNRVAEWRVYDDAPETRQRLQIGLEVPPADAEGQK